MPTAERLAWTPAAWEDDLYWQEQDRKPLRRIHQTTHTGLLIAWKPHCW